MQNSGGKPALRSIPAGKSVIPAPYMIHWSAVRWYRIDAASSSLLESGTISDPNLDLFYPSIAANTNRTVVIACNGTDVSTYLSCYAVVGQTVGGSTSFSNLLLLKDGQASYSNILPGDTTSR